MWLACHLSPLPRCKKALTLLKLVYTFLIILKRPWTKETNIVHSCPDCMKEVSFLVQVPCMGHGNLRLWADMAGCLCQQAWQVFPAPAGRTVLRCWYIYSLDCSFLPCRSGLIKEVLLRPQLLSLSLSPAAVLGHLCAKYRCPRKPMQPLLTGQGKLPAVIPLAIPVPLPHKDELSRDLALPTKL